MLSKKELIKKLEGTTLKITAEWLKENDEELLDFITEHEYWGRGYDFTPSKDTCVVELHFSDGGICYIATSTELDNWKQTLNNQSCWFEDEYSNCTDKYLNQFYQKIKKGVKINE